MATDAPSFFFGGPCQAAGAQAPDAAKRGGQDEAGREVKTFARKRRLCPPAAEAAKPADENASFCGAAKPAAPPVSTREDASGAAVAPASKRPAMRKPLVQMHLDFGQANFVCTTCKLCGMVYTKGQATDEKLHAAFHASSLQGVAFQGWQQERVLQTLGSGGRILGVFPGDTQSHAKKAAEICGFVESQLGMPKGWLFGSGCQVFLSVSAKRRVTGVLVAERITSAFATVPTAASPSRERASGSSSSSCATQQALAGRLGSGSSPAPLQPLPAGIRAGSLPQGRERLAEAVLAVDRRRPQAARLGVRGVWVSLEARRQGVATALLDAARLHDAVGEPVPRQLVAFTQPTEDGAALARRYAGSSDGSFLVYLESA